MCIAIYKPSSAVISDETLRNCFENNDDGCGFAYINTDNRGIKRIVVKKTLDFDVFMRQYKRATSIAPDSPFLIHFRIKTHGKITKDNCHPFYIDDNHVFIHNGIIQGMGYNELKSDTMLFNENYLQLLPDGWMNNEGIIKLISNVISTSKIVVMNIDGEVQICNHKAGKVVDGVWYSNESYKKRTFTTYNNYYTYSKKKSKPVSHTPKEKGSSNFLMQKCDNCGQHKDTSLLHYYYDKGIVLKYCGKCRVKAEDNFDIEDNNISYSCYREGIKEKIIDLSYRSFSKWSNPWDQQDYFSEQQLALATLN